MTHNTPVLTLVLLALSAICSVSCKEPPSREKFILAGDSIFGRYDFDLDMTDSTRTYDVTLFTRLDGTALPDSVPVSLSLVSPRGLSCDTTLVFGAGEGSLVDSSFFSRSMRLPYLKKYLPSESGVWRLSVYTRPTSYLRGIGLMIAHD